MNDTEKLQIQQTITSWINSNFTYNEWGTGADILIENDDGIPHHFAGFGNYLDAKAFLYLLEQLKSKQEKRLNGAP